MEPYIECDDIIKIFPLPEGEDTFAILRGITFKIYRGEFISLIGVSGVGKSTLINILAGELKPSAGVVKIDKQKIYEEGISSRTNFLRNKIGILFQNPRHNISGNLKVIDNILLPMILNSDKQRISDMKLRAFHLLREFGIETKANSKAYKLAGGELQRLGLCIACANDPILYLLDEPTSQLDPANTLIVMNYFHKLCIEKNRIVIMVTHDWKLAKKTHRTFLMKQGRTQDCSHLLNSIGSHDIIFDLVTTV
ncbi:MAG: ABC transporter ATP-binding protein [Promethearchaeota archaeon]